MTNLPTSKPSQPEPRGLAALNPGAADGGLSLDELNQAFAQLLGSGLDPYDATATADAPDVAEADEPAEPPVADADTACEITPRSILEAMLFVGHPSNEPLSATQVAGLMRGVRPNEIDDLVRDLNAEYVRNGCPYTVVSEGAGYRLVLREQYYGVRDKFYGRARASRLSPSALEVLSLLAYRGPMTERELCGLRGAASGSIVGQLVRRQLLEVERDAIQRTTRYRVSKRFLELFGLDRLEDLPRSQEVDQH
ncbi:MAG TPA: SMC-Scp complex subunit ScpB [Pirellulales bacterium]